MLLAPPAIQALQAPAATQALNQVQEQLEAIPEAFIAGKAGSMRTLVAKAQAGWKQALPELQKAMPEPERLAMEMQLKAMGRMKPREMAVGALGISSTLSRFQPHSRQQDLLNADRTAMLAWCTVDAKSWQQLPALAEAFRPLLEQDNGRHPQAVQATRESLKDFQASQQMRQPAAAKKILKKLLQLVDDFEKP